MKARILSDLKMDGLQYRVNQVVDLPSNAAKALEKDGQVDTDKAAVAYCIEELGAVVINHETASKTQAQIDYDNAVEAAAAARAAADAETDAQKRAELQSAVEAADAAVTDAKAALPDNPPA
jgi:hypothetical protein